MIVVASTARLDALLASIKLANNGYLILDHIASASLGVQAGV